tara:strand:- start:308 stop:670 length:363 start_codon:yes stop_codon:yes gene_type:complete
MTKVHHTIYKPRYEAHILETICSDYEGNELTTREAKINHLFHRIETECGWNVAKIGKQKAIAEWIAGLPLDIEYYYNDIVDMAIRFGSIDANPSEKLFDRVCDNYWSFMANIICGMEVKS